jgi:hypothetical protein
MAKFFDYILQGSDATEENAIQAARGLDWQEVETVEADYPNLQYVGTLNGVGIYYNYGHDGYYFTDEDAEDDYEPEEKMQEPIQNIDVLGDLGSYGLNEEEYNLDAILKQLERAGNSPSSEEISNIKSAIERDNSKKNSLKKESKVVKITMEHLQSIIKEGVARLHKQTLIENRIKNINEELKVISEGFDKRGAVYSVEFREDNIPEGFPKVVITRMHESDRKRLWDLDSGVKIRGFGDMSSEEISKQFGVEGPEVDSQEIIDAMGGNTASIWKR